MFCSQCGEKVELAGAVFCDKCGAKMVGAEDVGAEEITANTSMSPTDTTTSNLPVSPTLSTSANIEGKPTTVIVKNNRLKIIIAACALVVIAAAIIIPMSINNSRRNTIDSDFFIFSRDRVPTVSNILGWRSGSIRNEVRDTGNNRWLLSVAYFSDSVDEDMRRYAQALYDRHGFMVLGGALSSHSFSPEHGKFYMLGKPSEHDGHNLLVLIRRDEFDTSGFQVSYAQRRGWADLSALDPSVGLMATTVQEPVILSQTYTNDDEGFSFSFPSDWEVLDDEALQRYLVNPSPTLILDFRHRNATNPAPQMGIHRLPFDSHPFIANDWQFTQWLIGRRENVNVLEHSFVDVDGITARRAVTSEIGEDGEVWNNFIYLYAAGEYYFHVRISFREAPNRYQQVFAAVMDSFTITNPNITQIIPHGNMEPIVAQRNADYHIQVVMNGYLDRFPEISVGQAFESFFSLPAWGHFINDNGRNVVEFFGGLSINNEPARAQILFEFSRDSEYFTISSLVYDDGPQRNEQAIAHLLDVVFDLP